MNTQRNSSTKKIGERVTLYVKPEHRDLIQWALDYTGAASVSEAVLSAIAMLKAEQKEKQLKALDEIHGIWKDDPLIDEALKELEEGRESWRKRVEEY